MGGSTDTRRAGRGAPPTSSHLPRLTAREGAVLALIARGNTSCEAAAALRIGAKCIDFHVANLMRKFRSHTRAGMVARAYALGVVNVNVWPPTLSDRRSGTATSVILGRASDCEMSEHRRAG
jgi:DNA-binding CsgD family transcriptional regulator